MLIFPLPFWLMGKYNGVTDRETEEKKMLNNRKSIYAVIGLLALILAVAIVALAILSSAELQIQLKGDPEVPLEFGENYQDPGAEVVYINKLFGDKVVDVPVTVSVEAIGTDLGVYTVTYTASYMGHQATAQRQVRVVDTQAPVITLKYTNGSITLPGHEYVEEGFVAEDNYDGDITNKVQRQVVGDRVIYTVEDSSGNITVVERTIHYEDEVPPVLTLLGDSTITIQAGGKFTEPGYTATDNADGDITSKVTVSDNHSIYKAGTYTITYTVTDTFGNTTTATRTLVVKAASQPGTVTPPGGTIYLTFDDGPGPYTRQLLDVLKKYNVKATFFVCDKGDKYNKLMKDIVDEGHAIAIHSATHDYDKIYASEAAFFDDLNKMSDIIFEYSGKRTTLMRFPGGSSNMVSKFNPGIMTRLTKMVEDQGYQYFDWNVDSDDAGQARSADVVFNNVVHGKGTWRGCEDGKTNVVLQHDIHKYSVEAVERIIKWGLENGYQFLALDPTSPKVHHGINN